MWLFESCIKELNVSNGWLGMIFVTKRVLCFSKILLSSHFCLVCKGGKGCWDFKEFILVVWILMKRLFIFCHDGWRIRIHATIVSEPGTTCFYLYGHAEFIAYRKNIASVKNCFGVCGNKYWIYV